MTNRAHAARFALVVFAIVLTSATVPSQVRDAPAIGRLTGEMVVQSPDRRTIGKLEGTVSYSLPEQSGHTGSRFTPPDPATTVSASAEFTAVRQEDAFGAVTALMLALAGQVSNDRSSLRLSNIRVEGDPGAVRLHMNAIIAWWDEQATMAVPDYISPVLSSEHIGKLVFNVWGTEAGTSARAIHGYAILLFDPLNPGVVLSGRITRRDQSGNVNVVDLPSSAAFGTLIPISGTPMTDDYLLTMFGPIAGEVVHAELVIEPLPDGAFDVRGLARTWVNSGGTFTVEGIGNAKFRAAPAFEVQ